MSYLKSNVKKHLSKIVEETTLNVEVCNAFKDQTLVTRSEFQILINYMNNGKHSEGATYLYTTILDKIVDTDEDKFITALEMGGNSNAVTMLRQYPPDVQEMLTEAYHPSFSMDQ